MTMEKISSTSFKGMDYEFVAPIYRCSFVEENFLDLYLGEDVGKVVWRFGNHPNQEFSSYEIGLWLRANRLIGFDGVPNLPSVVKDFLGKQGITV